MNRNKENVEMESKFMRNTNQKKQGADDQHISGVAVTIFGVFIVITILGAVRMDRDLAGLLGA